jgi:hypothetical protein
VSSGKDIITKYRNVARIIGHEERLAVKYLNGEGSRIIIDLNSRR